MLSFGIIKSQNLVPNHDFHEIQNCDEDPIHGEDHDYLSHWFSPPSDVDSLLQDWMLFWHDCKKTGLKAHPFSGWNQSYPGRSDNIGLWCGETATIKRPKPLVGNGYIQLGCLDTVNHSFWNYYYNNCQALDSLYIDRLVTRGERLRSFASAKLDFPLDSGVDYTIEFHVLLERPGPVYAWPVYATSGLGAFLTRDTLKSSDYITSNLDPQVFSTKIISESNNWTKVSGSFVAKGFEQFISLGNFFKTNRVTVRRLPLDTIPIYLSILYCNYYFDAIYLYKSTDTLFNLTLPPDTTLCPGESLRLIPELDDGFKLEDTTKTWLWSTGSTDSVITVSEPGTYWVKVTYNERWWDSDTLVIHPYEAYESGLPPDTLVCVEKEFNLRVSMNPDIGLQWNTGNRRFVQTVAPPGGWYWISYEDECGTHYDSSFVEFQECDTNQAPVLYIPNSFSPNGDGLNDQWRIANLPKENEVWIFNRWGELVFTQKNYDGSWEGIDLSGEPLRQGIYVFRIRYRYYPGIDGEEMGSVQIMR